MERVAHLHVASLVNNFLLAENKRTALTKLRLEIKHDTPFLTAKTFDTLMYGEGRNAGLLGLLCSDKRTRNRVMLLLELLVKRYPVATRGLSKLTVDQIESMKLNEYVSSCRRLMRTKGFKVIRLVLGDGRSAEDFLEPSNVRAYFRYVEDLDEDAGEEESSSGGSESDTYDDPPRAWTDVEFDETFRCGSPVSQVPDAKERYKGLVDLSSGRGRAASKYPMFGAKIDPLGLLKAGLKQPGGGKSFVSPQRGRDFVPVSGVPGPRPRSRRQNIMGPPTPGSLAREKKATASLFDADFSAERLLRTCAANASFEQLKQQLSGMKLLTTSAIEQSRDLVMKNFSDFVDCHTAIVDMETTLKQETVDAIRGDLLAANLQAQSLFEPLLSSKQNIQQFREVMECIKRHSTELSVPAAVQAHLRSGNISRAVGSIEQQLGIVETLPEVIRGACKRVLSALVDRAWDCILTELKQGVPLRRERLLLQAAISLSTSHNRGDEGSPHGSPMSPTTRPGSDWSEKTPVEEEIDGRTEAEVVIGGYEATGVLSRPLCALLRRALTGCLDDLQRMRLALQDNGPAANHPEVLSPTSAGLSKEKSEAVFDPSLAMWIGEGGYYFGGEAEQKNVGQSGEWLREGLTARRLESSRRLDTVGRYSLSSLRRLARLMKAVWAQGTDSGTSPPPIRVWDAMFHDCYSSIALCYREVLDCYVRSDSTGSGGEKPRFRSEETDGEEEEGDGGSDDSISLPLCILCDTAWAVCIAIGSSVASVNSLAPGSVQGSATLSSDAIAATAWGVTSSLIVPDHCDPLTSFALKLGRVIVNRVFLAIKEDLMEASASDAWWKEMTFSDRGGGFCVAPFRLAFDSVGGAVTHVRLLLRTVSPLADTVLKLIRDILIAVAGALQTSTLVEVPIRGLGCDELPPLLVLIASCVTARTVLLPQLIDVLQQSGGFMQHGHVLSKLAKEAESTFRGVEEECWGRWLEQQRVYVCSLVKEGLKCDPLTMLLASSDAVSSPSWLLQYCDYLCSVSAVFSALFRTSKKSTTSVLVPESTWLEADKMPGFPDQRSIPLIVAFASRMTCIVCDELKARAKVVLQSQTSASAHNAEQVTRGAECVQKLFGQFLNDCGSFDKPAHAGRQRSQTAAVPRKQSRRTMLFGSSDVNVVREREHRTVGDNIQALLRPLLAGGEAERKRGSESVHSLTLKSAIMLQSVQREIFSHVQTQTMTLGGSAVVGHRRRNSYVDHDDGLLPLSAVREFVQDACSSEGEEGPEPPPQVVTPPRVQFVAAESPNPIARVDPGKSSSTSVDTDTDDDDSYSSSGSEDLEGSAV